MIFDEIKTIKTMLVKGGGVEQTEAVIAICDAILTLNSRLILLEQMYRELNPIITAEDLTEAGLDSTLGK